MKQEKRKKRHYDLRSSLGNSGRSKLISSRTSFVNFATISAPTADTPNCIMHPTSMVLISSLWLAYQRHGLNPSSKQWFRLQKKSDLLILPVARNSLGRWKS